MTTDLIDNIVNELVEATKELRTPESDEPESYDLRLYHATILDNWESISDKGIIAGGSKPAGQDWLGEYSGKGTYYHLMFPAHELDNSFDPDSGEPWAMVIEVKKTVPAEAIVPDEEAGKPEDTVDIISQQGPVVVGVDAEPREIKAVHLVDTEAARSWAEENIKDVPVKFHEPI